VLDTQEALVRQLEGAVKADQGQIDSAKLQLVYCQFRSPNEKDEPFPTQFVLPFSQAQA